MSCGFIKRDGNLLFLTDFPVWGFLCDSPVGVLHRRRCRCWLGTRRAKHCSSVGESVSGSSAVPERDEGCAGSCIVMSRFTLSPLLTTEEQSDAMLCPNHVTSRCATKKRMIAQSISDYCSGMLLATKERVLRGQNVWLLCVLTLSSLGSKWW